MKGEATMAIEIEGEIHFTTARGIKLKTEPGEESRVHRLGLLVGYVFARSPETYRHIESFLDHKGTLTVAWHLTPTNLEMQIVEQGWGSELCCEVEANVHHYVR